MIFVACCVDVVVVVVVVMQVRDKKTKGREREDNNILKISEFLEEKYNRKKYKIIKKNM